MVNQVYYRLTMLILSFVTGNIVFSQSWISLDGTKAGEEYSVKILESNAHTHQIRIEVHGFYDKIVEKDNCYYHQLQTNKGCISGKPGNPQFIAIPQLIAIPEGATYNIAIEEEEWCDKEIGIIYPAQKPWLDTEPEPDFIVNDSIYKQDVYSPSLLEIGKEQIWRNIKNFSVSVCPFRYFPKRNVISVLKSFVLRIDFANSSKTSSVTSEDLASAVDWHMFDNKIETFPSKDLRESPTKPSSENYNYLIIVGDIPEILNSQKLKDFRMWKAFKGYKSKVVSITTIGSTAANIQNYIAQEYENGVRYVLFIGDQSDIHLKFTQFDGRYIKGDYWYACFAGNNSFQAQLPIGRFSTSTLSEFSNMVDKTIAYESSFTGNVQNTLLVAHKENAPNKYQGCCEEIRTTSYSTPISFSTRYGASTDVGGNNATNASVISYINSGKHIINYRGHGTEQCWGTASKPWNTSNQCFTASLISNINLSSIYFNVCCNTGDITTEPCFMETFTRSAKGAVACLASTEEIYTIPADAYNKYLFSKLLNDDVWHIGELNMLSHIALCSLFYYAYYGAIENAHSFLCGGDPSLEIWTGTPAHFTDVTLTTSGNTMTVSYPSVYACTVCVVSESGELLIKKGLLGSSCSFTMPSGNFYVVVNKHNYYPYITLYNNVMNYAQDKTTNVNTSLLK